ncbi:FAD-dependent oxidoreductase [Hymenobacter sp. CRA2]|uniref:FAD-dependent oxidoreductase n=1 Tax=Hymenobacter sp. CRA2 TaxID=1955620 RepID=UPI0009902269|nr:FAD-dependent oxidoreductase [Hymenobacter sp. CRA2]OON67978.1 FAD-dependent oxidoreductase [Hymenobacter sp. CRA2]
MKATLASPDSASTQPIYDVIIAGAGPVGLFLACELALRHCRVLVLEKADSLHAPLKQLPFGLRGLNALSVEALYRRGLQSELQVSQRLKAPHFSATAPQGQRPQVGGHFAGIQFPSEKIDPAQWPYRLPGATEVQLLSELEELETVLARRAAGLGVAIRRGLALTDFQQTTNGVMVQAGNQTLQGMWLVGCDGSRSEVRKMGGFDFVGTEPEFTGYTALVDIVEPEKLKPGRNVTPTGMYLQSQPGYLILQDFDGGAFHQSQKPVTQEHFQQLLRRISGTDVTITALHIATTWTDRARQATDYRRGRVLLAGDAAHIHSPLGGQGLNLGLGDALNLGWKLAAIIHEQAPEGLLDSYQTERHPIGAQVLDWSRAQVAIMEPRPQAQALRALISDLMNTRDGATYFAGRVWGVTTHYDLGGKHPLVGRSAPNFAFEDGTTLGEHMHDGRGILLDFDQNADWQALARAYGDQLKYLSGRAKEPLGLSTLLIRPDGFVAWASDNGADTSECQRAAARWFGQRSVVEAKP